MKQTLLLDLMELNAAYASAIDENNWDTWIDFFTEDCEYKIQPRENFERGFPLATLALLSKNMLRDRAYGIKETLFHDPYYQRHIIGTPHIIDANNDVITAKTNYSVFRTKLSQETTVFNVGFYLDKLVKLDGKLKIRSRICVYDSEMIPNSIIYPI